MSEQEHNISQQEQENSAKLKRSWRDVVDTISYKGIVHNIPYLLFIALLCVIYIANSSRAVSLTRELTKKNKELKELKWEYLDVQSSLMQATSETELTNKSATIGLKPLDKPAFEIRIKNKTTHNK